MKNIEAIRDLREKLGAKVEDHGGMSPGSSQTTRNVRLDDHSSILKHLEGSVKGLLGALGTGYKMTIRMVC